MIPLTLLVGLMALLQSHHASGSCPIIKSWHGSFITDDDITNCEIHLNGSPIPSESLASIRGYGLLQVSCEGCAFSLVSTFGTCDDCIICAHNEGILKCRSIALPVALAVVLTALILVLITTSLLVLDRKVEFAKGFMQWLATRKGRKVEKRAGKVRPIIAQELQRLTADDKSNGRPTKVSHPESSESDLSKSASGPSLTQVLATVLLATSPARACDDVFLMSSEGLIITNSTAISMTTGLFTIHSGSTICFKYPDGSQESLKLHRMVRTMEYSSIYQACSFNITTDSRLRCAWTSECWDDSTCRYGYKDPVLASRGMPDPNEEYGCEMVPNSSKFHCTHEQICVWYKWLLKPEYEVCDGILSLVGSSQVLELIHTSKNGDVIPFELSASSPGSTTPMPLHLVNIMSQSQQKHQYLRLHGGVFYGTTACEINNPIPGVLGDMQVGLNSEESVYPKWAVDCRVDGSEVNCLSPEPGYYRSLKRDLKNKVNVMSVKGTVAMITEEDRGTASLMFRTISKPATVVEPASCSFKVDYSYGCTGCIDKPFLVITPIEIRTTGVMKFSSNCSFYLPEVECSPVPQKLQLLERPDACSVTFTGSNNTVVVTIPYEFRGEIYSMGVVAFRSRETFTEKLSLGIQSPEFLNSLKLSLGAGALLAAATTVIRSALRYAAFRAGQKELSDA